MLIGQSYNRLFTDVTTTHCENGFTAGFNSERKDAATRFSNV